MSNKAPWYPLMNTSDTTITCLPLCLPSCWTKWLWSSLHISAPCYISDFLMDFDANGLFRYLSSGEKDCIGILIRMRTDTGKMTFLWTNSTNKDVSFTTMNRTIQVGFVFAICVPDYLSCSQSQTSDPDSDWCLCLLHPSLQTERSIYLKYVQYVVL